MQQSDSRRKSDSGHPRTGASARSVRLSGSAGSDYRCYGLAPTTRPVGGLVAAQRAFRLGQRPLPGGEKR
ncbi:hypothetical protein KKH18_11535 [bacterium]|nr:hypothetical protein [bacterium]